ncbi:helix-turn-helix transcriptional regulator [Catellatospora tritici]|uniref:helix-turn-helix transcriptional regulator n=1 Tax=Catellatospora tritici TaxID=2851566 RepID=UPI001C2D0306|nr:LuxR family transcriptional regulator [Catellatospora tritici]MBV1854785.1 AAA family ATPase [Catellatospora tritici]
MTVDSPVFVGRRTELAQLDAAARAATAGQGGAVLVVGESGIGKTTLLDAAVARCRELGLRVHRGAAEELEQEIPFSTLAACLGIGPASTDPDLAPLSGLLRGEDVFVHGVAAANHEYAIGEAVLALADNWTAAGPLALIVDDLQWADTASLRVLDRLAEGVATMPLLLVLAKRSVDRSGEVAGFWYCLLDRGAPQLRLASLPAEAVADQVTGLLGAPPGPRLRGLLDGAAGNPLYIRELVTALRDDQAIHVVDGVAEVGDRDSGDLPGSLVGVIGRRLDALPGSIRDALRTAAVLGGSVSEAELAEVLDSPPEDVAAAMGIAARGGLVTAGRRPRFRHSLICEVLAAQVPATVRAALHVRGARVLARRSASVTRVAEQLAQGGRVEPAMRDWLAEHARTLIARAPGLAVLLLRRALTVTEPARTEELRLHLVRALLWHGELETAEANARQALTTAPATARAALYWLLVQACYRQGRLDDALAVVDTAVADPDVGEVKRGHLHGIAAVTMMFQVRLDDAAEQAQLALAVGAATGDEHALGLGELAMAAVTTMRGDVPGGLALARQAQRRLGHGVLPDLQVEPDATVAYCLIGLDRLVEADEALALAAERNRRTGGAYLAFTHRLRAAVRFFDGRWDDALMEIQTGLETADPLREAERLRGLAGVINVHRGRWAEMAGTLSEQADSPYAGGDQSFARWAYALTREATVGAAEALRLLLPVWEQTGGIFPKRVVYRVCPDLARMAAACGEQERLARLVEEVREVAGDEPCPSLRATLQLCRAVAEGDVELMLAAAVSYGEAGWRLWEGYAYENAGVLLARAGQAGPAREQVDRALAIYEQLDAEWDAGRAGARLREAGVRRGVKGRRGRPKHGWAALTETEHRVALMVAEGMSNPEIAAQMFLSRRTVQSHVSSILAKLQISSRVELAVVAAQHEAISDRRVS